MDGTINTSHPAELEQALLESGKMRLPCAAVEGIRTLPTLTPYGDAAKE